MVVGGWWVAGLAGWLVGWWVAGLVVGGWVAGGWLGGWVGWLAGWQRLVNRFRLTYIKSVSSRRDNLPLEDIYDYDSIRSIVPSRSMP